MAMRIFSSTCLHCGARMRDARVQPHCQTDACNRGYAEHVARVSVRQEGDCEVWTGKHSSAGTAIVVVKVNDEGLRKDIRALDLRFEMAGLEKGTNRRYRNLCGTKNCVTVAHHEVMRWQKEEPDTLPGKLDPAPLLARIENTWREVDKQSRRHVRECMDRGWISVGKVDEICCTMLRIHPAELYGEEFFTA